MYNTYTLKNGLRVITEKIDHLNSISVGVMVQNGSRNEIEELNGISHFIEHMFFKGTNKRNAKQIVEDIENVGNGTIYVLYRHIFTKCYTRIFINNSTSVFIKHC